MMTWVEAYDLIEEIHRTHPEIECRIEGSEELNSHMVYVEFLREGKLFGTYLYTPGSWEGIRELPFMRKRGVRNIHGL